MRRKIAVSPLRPGPSAGATSPQVGRAALSLRGVWPARRTELARNSPGSLAHCSRQPLFKTAWKDALGRVNYSNRADRAAGVVEDRGRHARLAEHGFVSLRGDTLVPDRRDLFAQRCLIERLLREGRGRFSKQVVDHLLRREGEDRLAQRTGMQRQLKADLQHTERGVRTKH